MWRESFPLKGLLACRLAGSRRVDVSIVVSYRRTRPSASSQASAGKVFTV